MSGGLSWSGTEWAPWVALGALGAYHGINPAMGWLFAVALGLQRRSRKAVLGALLPIALGHEASIALVVLLVSGLQFVAAPQVLRPLGAAALIGFGVYKFVKPRSHPRWVGMRVGGRDLALWSFLMSSAHGAGLMLFPIVLGLPSAEAAGHVHEGGMPHVHLFGARGGDLGTIATWTSLTGEVLAEGAAAVTVHTGAMLLAMAAVAVIVYERVGVAVLRRAWVNLDTIWAGAAVVAGVFTLFTG
jgi:hypothetical protein